MSITRTAIRIAATRAIAGRTLAGARVSDSAIEPIDVAVSDTRLPIVIVTTDDDSTDGTGRDVWSGRREIDLVIEVAVATEVKNGTFTIPETDFGLEWALDIIEHQIDRALLDEGTEWSKIFMGLVPRIHSKMSRRGASAERGVRFAARQIVYKVDAIAAPMPGEAIEPLLPYGRLLTAMAADGELAEYSAFLRSIIEEPMKPDWKRSAEAIGITAEDAEDIGIAPLGGTSATAERGVVDVGLSEVDVTVHGRSASLSGDANLDADGTKV